MKFAKALSSAALAATLIATLPTLAQANDVTRQIKVDDSFHEGVVTWTATAPRMTYLIKLINVDGMIEVCGVYAVDRGRNSSFNQFLRDSGFKIGGKRVIKSLRYWNRVKVTELKTSLANCKATGVPVTTNGKMDLAWSQRTYRF